MSLIYKKEDQITKSANELQELIQGESCPKIPLKEILYDFIDKHPGISINEIQTKFSQFDNFYIIMDTLHDMGEIYFINKNNEWYILPHQKQKLQIGWYTKNYLEREAKRIELKKLRQQIKENKIKNKLEDWQIEQEKKLNTYNGQVLSSTSEERELYFESYEDNSFYNEARGD